MKKVLEIIMDSNMSKLGSDGQPIYDSVGKVIKGPNYWKPEPKLQAYIQGEIDALGAVASKVIATTVASILPMGGVTESTPTP
jgi:predicted HAD superfamily Cof-like phosphohydrolase